MNGGLPIFDPLYSAKVVIWLEMPRHGVVCVYLKFQTPKFTSKAKQTHNRDAIASALLPVEIVCSNVAIIVPMFVICMEVNYGICK